MRRLKPNNYADGIHLTQGRLQPVGGWPLELLGSIEAAMPGFIWKVMATRPLWRQAVFAVLAKGALDDPAQFLQSANGWDDDLISWPGLLRAFGETILTLRPREIVEIGLGSCPSGFIGALDKLPFHALTPEFYRTLFDLFASDDPLMKRRRRVLEQLPILDEGRLDAVLNLDLAVLSPTVVDRFPTARAAERLGEQIAIVRMLCSTATDAAVRASLEGEAPNRYPGWLERWLQKVDRPLPHQLPTDALDFLERVTPATAKSVGEAFDNCLGRDPEGLTSLMSSGVFAMLAWRDAGLLIELTLLDDGTWMARRIHARSNATVTDEMRLKVRAALEPVGVVVPIAAASPPELTPVIRELGTWRAPLIDMLDIE